MESNIRPRSAAHPTTVVPTIGRAQPASPTPLTEEDRQRLSTQLWCVYTVLLDGGWQTTSETHSLVGWGESTSIASRRRQLRERGWIVEKRHRNGSGAFEYRLVNPHLPR